MHGNMNVKSLPVSSVSPEHIN